MITRNTTLGLLGGGNMAEAIIKGMLALNVLPPGNLIVTDRSPERCAYLRSTFPIPVLENNLEVMQRADAILFAVKPQNMKDLLAEILPVARPEQFFLSICAGTTTSFIEGGLQRESHPTPRVVRIMPNLPALIGLGTAGVSRGTHATKADLDFTNSVFECVGEVIAVPESMMDAVTALTGSGPAYVFFMIESLVDAGTAVGFSRDDATKMVLQMVRGSAKLATQSDKSPAELRRAVTSPGGTTAAGIAVMEQLKVREAIVAAVQAAEQRGKELGKA